MLLRYLGQGEKIMEVTFSINFDLSKNKNEKSKNSSGCGCCPDGESNLEKWLETAQKIVKSVKVK